MRFRFSNIIKPARWTLSFISNFHNQSLSYVLKVYKMPLQVPKLFSCLNQISRFWVFGLWTVSFPSQRPKRYSVLFQVMKTTLSTFKKFRNNRRKFWKFRQVIKNFESFIVHFRAFSFFKLELQSIPREWLVQKVYCSVRLIDEVGRLVGFRIWYLFLYFSSEDFLNFV